MVIQVFHDLDDQKRILIREWWMTNDLVREIRRRMASKTFSSFFSNGSFMMSDEKKEEEKGGDSETDYGSDTWLADFDVDQFIRN